MINTNKFVYFRLQKCASRTLAEYFKKEFGTKDRIAGTHIPARGKKKEGKLFVASIRNPWDWYVSWHTFIKHDKRYKDFYHPDFNTFMRKIMSRKNGVFGTNNKISFPEMQRLDVGVFSYRYLDMLGSKKPQNMKQEELFNHNLIRMDYFIDMSDIESSVLDLYKKIDYDCNSVELANFNKTKRTDYRDYYDEDVIELVRHKDRIIIERFGYEF